ncbi:tail fiber assembly protein [Xenorhabdus bovienii]|uniref:tail fiber assembly protein n=1 Tax=Xenorhabdus bovienii TaxID=40576 RepID=UPI0023B35280|nr:tail fiber assembly protein [Xenorhabdus bovienii]MDE9434421.1 tail fiber assembly protein [Xenorhabdus bovienii]MDE9462493.1 tail fiber assembly protein [Xenorhabdus bovienii]MDE9470422.1 tail fiber assembly protein [Xenorhabdus bovienii]MDE9496659.1 tail fiber assembly protein [Xenorhabdus bovienii]
MVQPTEPPVQFDENGFALSYGWVQVYCANTISREYIGTKRERTFIGITLSAGSYLDESKLPKSPNKAICRTVDGKSWEYALDYRGKTAYHIQTRKHIAITEIGDIPTELTLLEPNTPFDKWNGTQWVTDVEALNQHEMNQAESQKQQLLIEVFHRIAPLQDAVDLDIATGQEIAQLKEWRKYRVLLNRVDCSTAPDIAWPEQPK